MNSIIESNVIYWDRDTAVTTVQHQLLQEEPLSIRIEGRPYVVVMRTPGDEKAHVIGFCLGEGIIDEPEEILSIALCDGSDTNTVTVTLQESRRAIAVKQFDRRSYISQSSCGLCGKELIEQIFQEIKPIKGAGVRMNVLNALQGLLSLSHFQPMRDQTGASHAALVYDAEFNPLASAEDVGRHNALDKVIGKLLLQKSLSNAKILILSSRISYEMVQKAARARIPVMLAMSRPTALAVEMGKRLNMTLASLVKEKGLYIYCGEHRIFIKWDAA